MTAPSHAKKIAYNGESLTIRQWAERLGIKYDTLLQRLERMSVEKALTKTRLWERNQDSNYARLVFAFNGETMSLRRWSKKLDIQYGTLWRRIFRQSMPVEEAFKMSINERKSERYRHRDRIIISHRKKVVESRSDARERFAASVGISLTDIGFIKPQERTLTDEKAWELYHGGWNATEISSYFRMSPNAVYARLRRHPDYNELARLRHAYHRATMFAQMRTMISRREG